MTTDRTVFVGFALLEDLLSTHRNDTPLYMAAPSEVRSTDTPGFGYRHTYILVADIQDGIIRYWRFAIGQCAEQAGTDLDFRSAQAIRERAERAEAELRSILKEQYQIEPQNAVPSFPLNYRFLQGGTRLIEFDVVAKQFCRAKAG
jgi:hypothetical protein